MDCPYDFEIATGDKQQYLWAIVKETLDVFGRLGLAYDNQKRTIVGGMPCPRFCPKEDNAIPYDQIHLTMTDYNYWCQVIYQLSHELTHCFIHCHNNSKLHSASWIEETICEAVSLFFLSYFQQHWRDSQLYAVNPEYDKSVLEYLSDIEDHPGTGRLSSCRSYEELLEINASSAAQRDDRKDEMLSLYRLMGESDIKGLVYYKDYMVPGKKVLNTRKYLAAFPDNAAVGYFCGLQNAALESDNIMEAILCGK